MSMMKNGTVFRLIRTGNKRYFKMDREVVCYSQQPKESDRRIDIKITHFQKYVSFDGYPPVPIGRNGRMQDYFFTRAGYSEHPLRLHLTFFPIGRNGIHRLCCCKGDRRILSGF